MRMLLWSLPCVVVLGLVAATARAATATFTCTFTGTSETFGGEKEKVFGQGTMTVDDVTGAVTYVFVLNDGFSIKGSGGAAITPKGRFLGSTSTDIDGIRGTAVLEGKSARAGSRLDVLFTAGVPNRFGAGPQGFAFTKLRVKATRQP